MKPPVRVALGVAAVEDQVGERPDAGNAFISQRHALGRVSFIDIATGDVRTITGFDLNSRIVD